MSLSRFVRRIRYRNADPNGFLFRFECREVFQSKALLAAVNALTDLGYDLGKKWIVDGAEVSKELVCGWMHTTSAQFRYQGYVYILETGEYMHHYRTNGVWHILICVKGSDRPL